MGALSRARSLGGVGSVLLGLSTYSFVGPVTGIVGFILVLLAVKHISEIVGQKSIYSHAIISVTLGILAFVVGLWVGLARFLNRDIIFGLPRFFGPFMAGFDPSEFIYPRSSESIVGFSLIVLSIVSIISAVYLYRSFSSIAAHLNLGLFKTASIIYLIGAVLVVVIVSLDRFIIFGAAIIQTIAFLSLKDKAPSS